MSHVLCTIKDEGLCHIQVESCPPLYTHPPFLPPSLSNHFDFGNRARITVIAVTLTQSRATDAAGRERKTISGFQTCFYQVLLSRFGAGNFSIRSFSIRPFFFLEFEALAHET